MATGYGNAELVQILQDHVVTGWMQMVYSLAILQAAVMLPIWSAEHTVDQVPCLLTLTLPPMCLPSLLLQLLCACAGLQCVRAGAAELSPPGGVV
jgi:hypothetical protein